MTTATEKRGSGTEKNVPTTKRDLNVGTDAVLIFPRAGETAADLLAVMTLIGFTAEATTSYDGEDS